MSPTAAQKVSSGRSGPMDGFVNQTRREASGWLGTGRWLRQALAWTAILAGLFVLMRWAMPTLLPDAVAGGAGTVEQTAMQFTEMTAIVTAIGVVLLTAGVLVDERRDGVLEWLLSKPLTRPALILAKFTGHSLGLIIPVVLVPWIVVYALLSVAAGGPWHQGRTAAVVGMLALLVAFHLALVLALSTFTRGRVAVLAVPLVMIVSADLVTAVIPDAFRILPWSLGRLAGALLAEGVLVSGWPMLATVAWTAVLLGAASWRLAQTDL